ncbi:MAG: prepilin peptidase [Candidatus Paceibacterota bacterium]
MTLVVPGAFFLTGAAIASFVGVIVVRLHTGQSFLTGHSRCDACNATLKYASLLPIISYVASRGRSRCCKSRISYVAPLSEVLLGSLFVLAYLTLGVSAALFWTLLSLSLLLALVSYDLLHQILPSPLLYVFIAVSALSAFFASPSKDVLSTTLLTALLIAMFLAALHVFSRGRAMGFADAPLAFGLALLTGPVALSGFMFSFWIGAVIGIALLARRPAGSRMGVEVPFAPFLAAGFLLAYFTQWNPLTLIAALPFMTVQ